MKLLEYLTEIFRFKIKICKPKYTDFEIFNENFQKDIKYTYVLNSC